MKKLFILFAIALTLILSSSKNTYASHFAGADLTYTCLGGSTYLITYSFYRDCSGIQAPTTVLITFNCSSNSTFNFNTTLSRIPGTGQEITHACSAVPTHCNNGNGYGIQEYVYQGTVSLAPCNSWDIHYTSGARNPISTLSVGGNWYSMAMLNNLNAPSNSSPVFTSKPVAVVCSNQSFCFNQGAYDADGDSLVYSFYPVMTTSPTATVTYNTPWSYTNFLTATNPPGITIDSTTGDICFTATANLTTVYGVKIEEYRNIGGTAVLVGTIYRDVQLRVISCGGNHIPVLSGIDTSLSKTYSPNDTIFDLEQCLSVDPTIFNIYGFDADTFNPTNSGHPEQFTISWNNAIPNATFTPHFNGTDSAYATFSWQPNSFDVNKKRCFTATIMDEACAYNALQSFTYCILTKGMLVDIGMDTMVCEGESVVVKADADSSATNYIWSVDGSLAGIPLNQDSIIIDTNTYGTGLHTVSIEVNDGIITNSCPGVDQIMVDIVYQPHINGVLPDTTICSFQTVTYDAGPGQQYRWTDLGLNPMGASQTFTTNHDNIYIVTVNGGVNTRCYDVDTFEVIVPPSPPPFSFGPDITIAPNQTLVLSMPTVQAPHYWWNTGDTTHSITIDSSFNWINKIIGLTTFGNQCYSSDTIYVYIGSVGMEENSDSPLKIYPNPVQSFINIELKESYTDTKVEILDINGKQISKTHFEGKFYKLSSLEALPKGIYILHLQNKELNVLLRFVKE
jgi:hypothetical protein